MAHNRDNSRIREIGRFGHVSLLETFVNCRHDQLVPNFHSHSVQLVGILDRQSKDQDKNKAYQQLYQRFPQSDRATSATWRSFWAVGWPTPTRSSRCYRENGW